MFQQMFNKISNTHLKIPPQYRRHIAILDISITLMYITKLVEYNMYILTFINIIALEIIWHLTFNTVKSISTRIFNILYIILMKYTPFNELLSSIAYVLSNTYIFYNINRNGMIELTNRVLTVAVLILFIVRMCYTHIIVKMNTNQ